MTIYDPAKHEMLVLKLYLDLAADPVEFKNLFSEPFRNLTTMLHYIKHEVKMAFEVDQNGIWAAAWMEPSNSGAFFGFWIRKEYRASFKVYAFLSRAFDYAFQHVPILIGITKQKRLDGFARALGYEYKCEIPYWFDGDTAYLYTLEKEQWHERIIRRRGRVRGRREKHLVKHDIQPLRSGSVRDGATTLRTGGESLQAPVGADGGSGSNGRSERPNPDHQPKRGRRKRRGIDLAGINEASLGPSGSGG